MIEPPQLTEPRVGSSAPAYQSPIRHHRRTPSRSKGVKETLDAKSQYGSGDDNDGASVHRINQYIIKQEIGRGSFGAVHLAQDSNGHEYVSPSREVLGLCVDVERMDGCAD